VGRHKKKASHRLASHFSCIIEISIKPVWLEDTDPNAPCLASCS